MSDFAPEKKSFEDKVREIVERYAPDIFRSQLEQPLYLPKAFRSWVPKFVEDQGIQLPASQVIGSALEPNRVVGQTGEPAFENGATNQAGFATTAFYRHDGRVYLRGTVDLGASFTNGDAIFTLPEGYRPVAVETFLVVVGAGSGRIQIQETGEVLVMTGVSDTFCQLSGISFRVST